MVWAVNNSSIMSEKPVSPVTGEPLKVENYYFQIVLGKLVSKAAVAEPFSNLRFSIFKGTLAPTKENRNLSQPKTYQASSWRTRSPFLIIV